MGGELMATVLGGNSNGSRRLASLGGMEGSKQAMKMVDMGSGRGGEWHSWVGGLAEERKNSKWAVMEPLSGSEESRAGQRTMADSRVARGPAARTKRRRTVVVSGGEEKKWQPAWVKTWQPAWVKMAREHGNGDRRWTVALVGAGLRPAMRRGRRRAERSDGWSVWRAAMGGHLWEVDSHKKTEVERGGWPWWWVRTGAARRVVIRAVSGDGRWWGCSPASRGSGGESGDGGRWRSDDRNGQK